MWNEASPVVSRKGKKGVVAVNAERTTSDEQFLARERLKERAFVSLNMFAISKLATPSLPVVDLWSKNDPVLAKMPMHCERNMLPHASFAAAHRVKACSREASQCSSMQVPAKKIVRHLHCNNPS